MKNKEFVHAAVSAPGRSFAMITYTMHATDQCDQPIRI